MRRMAVFAGGCQLDALERVGGLGERTATLVASLVDKSLVVVRSVAGRTRYRLLETVRVYAADRLAADARRRVRQQRLALDHALDGARVAGSLGVLGAFSAALLGRGQFAVAPPYFDRVEAMEAALAVQDRAFWRLQDAMCAYGLADLDRYRRRTAELTALEVDGPLAAWAVIVRGFELALSDPVRALREYAELERVAPGAVFPAARAMAEWASGDLEGRRSFVCCAVNVSRWTGQRPVPS